MQIYDVKRCADDHEIRFSMQQLQYKKGYDICFDTIEAMFTWHFTSERKKMHFAVFKIAKMKSKLSSDTDLKKKTG